MERKILSTIREQGESPITMFGDSVEYTIDDIAIAFAGYSRQFASLTDAIDHLPTFVDTYYRGNDVNKFKNTIRAGYTTIVKYLFDGVQQSLERRVLQVI